MLRYFSVKYHVYLVHLLSRVRWIIFSQYRAISSCEQFGAQYLPVIPMRVKIGFRCCFFHLEHLLQRTHTTSRVEIIACFSLAVVPFAETNFRSCK